MPPDGIRDSLRRLHARVSSYPLDAVSIQTGPLGVFPKLRVGA